jgi:twitching motility protein PilT
MEQLNDYLRALLATCSNELHLEPNRSPYLVSDNGSSDVSPTPLVGTSISTMVFPIIPDDAKKTLPSSPEINFIHTQHFGSFNFNVKKSPAGFMVTVKPILRSDDPPVAVSVNTPTTGQAAPAPAVFELDTDSVFGNQTNATAVPKVEVTSMYDQEFTTRFVDDAAYAPAPPPADRIQPQSHQQTVGAQSPVVAPQSFAPTAAYAAAEAPYTEGRTRMEKLLRLMSDAGGSDLHLSVGMPPMVRLDGSMRVLDGGGQVITESVMKELLTSIMPKRNEEEFERRNDTDFAYEIPGLARFRSNVFRDRKGMGGVFRVIPSKILTAEQLGLSKAIMDMCGLNKGLVVVTGPTGSGKSTTLCAMVDHINKSRTDHIITIEDPIEFVHENQQCLINQREVHNHTDSFKDALRAALREDPDIVLVGEMRDLETIAIAIETAETGHLVFGTLHTTTAASTVDRIIDQFPADRQQQIRVMLSESLKGVIAQTLLPKKGGGRVAALEILVVTPAIANLIREGKTFQIPSAMQTGRNVGMVMLNDALLEHVQSGAVEAAVAYQKAVDKTGFEVMLKRGGYSI